MISFATIALIWIEHHGMMSAVRFVNRRFLERTFFSCYSYRSSTGRRLWRLRGKDLDTRIGAKPAEIA